MKKILITRPMPDAVVVALAKAHKVAVRDDLQPMSRDELIAALARFDAILPTIGDAFLAEIFAAAGEIRAGLLANFGVGYNHIDVTSARAHGVEVTNTPGVLTDATADLALTLLLATARRAGEGERMLRAGLWQGWHPTQLLGQHVTGKRLGIVGMGRIGEGIARRCHFGFGMEVAYLNRSEKVLDFPARRVDTLTALAADVDFLVVAVPGGAETRHLIGAEVFSAMKSSGILVNIARGDVVDEAALIAALEAGEIAGAGLDVYENEPQVPEALRGMENVTLLPHLGSATLETRTAMGLLAADNILAFLAGEPPISPV
ncbi:2-hydroxyacid dehydrogenase [Sinisalibacter lacisalsi]|uniref:D-glycerate dehydrogenase n=1 Tax=Sinisalibacter lacisalsi TaxID=1526570 RepID=A0ABQ1QP25_9RHOB|nr:D-glycerate dehydrogenase [Sinisalibacter lacisalsi]GGD38693.1 D-glycerate dehydrogenase [Sinisalibacter lacisalsi]